jgi:hypothetical protein
MEWCFHTQGTRHYAPGPRPLATLKLPFFWAEAQERLRIEEAKAAAEIAKARAEERKHLEPAENERIKALAAMKMADAAMLDAQKPPMVINNNNSNSSAVFMRAW